MHTTEKINSRTCGAVETGGKPWTNAGYNIVIAAQRSDSEQWAGQPPTVAWLTETANTIRKYTDRPIVIRPHPRQRISDIPGCVIEMPRPIQGTYDSFDYDRCLSTAWAVVNHNSGPGSQAVLNGVPAFVDSSSLAAPVGNTRFIRNQQSCQSQIELRG
jgi:hypothetical protein